jgi:thiol-disulfide isomerase/thioredoxin
MSLKSVLCTATFGLVLLAANSHAQTVPAGRASTSVTNALAAGSPAVVADESIRPFPVNVPEEQLRDLRRRIAATRWPDRETVADRSQGAPLDKLQELVRHWGSGYDWRNSFLVGIRRTPGLAMIIGVVVVTLHSLEPVVLAASPALVDEGPMPDLGGAIGWLNSAPLNRRSLRGKVVLVDFWTYTCINSLRPLPYVKSWVTKYKDSGFVVIGAHTPEFSFEKQRENVEKAVHDLKVTYPVAIDSDYEIWRAFNNQYWPAQYLIDAKGRIRYHHFGEGEYGQLERVIQQLLKEKGATAVDTTLVSVSADGVEAAPDFEDERFPETYIGYLQAEHFVSPERLARDSRKTYSSPARLSQNQWALAGSWNVDRESAVPQTAGGKIVFRFHSRDLHLVLSPPKDSKPVRFKVLLDGNAPGENCGSDSSPDGTGEVREPRLYQLIRQKGPVQDRTFEIEFLDPGVHALDFTFG